MKRIATEQINEDATLEKIKDIIYNLHSDGHDFIVLSEDGSQSFIQALDMDGEYMMEYRKYQDETNFKHQRLYANNMVKVQNYFEAFFNDGDIDISEWEDVTSEF